MATRRRGAAAGVCGRDRATAGARRKNRAQAGAMKIAIDARELQGKPTGVGRYVSELLAAWKSMPAASAHEFILLRPGSDGGGTRWEQLALPGQVRRAGAGVLFAPAYTGPLRCPVPMVVAIHDVSFAAHPEWF